MYIARLLILVARPPPGVVANHSWTHLAMDGTVLCRLLGCGEFCVDTTGLDCAGGLSIDALIASQRGRAEVLLSLTLFSLSRWSSVASWLEAVRMGTVSFARAGSVGEALQYPYCELASNGRLSKTLVALSADRGIRVPILSLLFTFFSLFLFSVLSFHVFELFITMIAPRRPASPLISDQKHPAVTGRLADPLWCLSTEQTEDQRNNSPVFQAPFCTSL